jgi:primosomal protein N'
MIITVYNARKEVIAWETKCAQCDAPVTFKKGGHHWEKNRSAKKPGITARCWDCWQKTIKRGPRL